MSHLQLSARAYHRILKLARTIADLAGEEEIPIPRIWRKPCSIAPQGDDGVNWLPLLERRGLSEGLTPFSKAGLPTRASSYFPLGTGLGGPFLGEKRGEIPRGPGNRGKIPFSIRGLPENSRGNPGKKPRVWGKKISGTRGFGDARKIPRGGNFFPPTIWRLGKPRVFSQKKGGFFCPPIWGGLQQGFAPPGVPL